MLAPPDLYRTVATWGRMVPDIVWAAGRSAVISALHDAQRDIVTLEAECQRLRAELLAADNR